MTATAQAVPDRQQSDRRHDLPFDPHAYELRNLIERMFCQLKDWRRIATNYDKVPTNLAAAVTLAVIVMWWLSLSPERDAFASEMIDFLSLVPNLSSRTIWSDSGGMVYIGRLCVSNGSTSVMGRWASSLRVMISLP